MNILPNHITHLTFEHFEDDDDNDISPKYSFETISNNIKHICKIITSKWNLFEGSKTYSGYIRG